MESSELRQKVLKALGLDDDVAFSDEVLGQMLKKKRAKYHPDKMPDDDLKEDFDNKFIEYNNLYREFTESKVKETELMIVPTLSQDLDYYQTKQENIELEDEVIELKKEKAKKDNEINNLKNAIKIVSRDSIIKERESLIHSIKSQNKRYLSVLGIIAGLTLGVNILSKFGEISNILNDSFQININYVLISLFSVICIIYIYKLIKESIIQKLSQTICSSYFFRKFGKDRYSNFSETDVVEFIESELKTKKGITSCIYGLIFNVYEKNTIEVLKQIFIFELFSRNLIRFGETYGLEQKYLIIRQHTERDDDGNVYIKEY